MHKDYTDVLAEHFVYIVYIIMTKFHKNLVCAKLPGLTTALCDQNWRRNTGDTGAEGRSQALKVLTA
eukprot:3506407-Amphidinium_carterae.1